MHFKIHCTDTFAPDKFRKQRKRSGMGVKFKNVHNVIPRRMDTFVQQMGRPGRDGQFSQELIIFKPRQCHISKVENDLLKLANDSEICRNQISCSAYLTEKSVIYPLHNCCDVCEIVCACDTFIIWQVMKYREICIRYNQYLKKLYFHM